MRKLIREQVKFLIVGFGAFLIDFAILNGLVYGLDYRDKLFDFALIANIISTITAVLFAFYFQRHWTFRASNSGAQKQEFGLFVGLQAFNVLIYSTLMFNYLINTTHILIPIAKIIVVAIQMISSYLVMKFVIFKKQPTTGREQS